MSQEMATVKRLFACWEALDPQAVASCFHTDGIWHNMPYAPINGPAAIAAVVAKFLDGATHCHFEVSTIAQIRPGVIVTERVDVFSSNGADELRLPVMGIFEVEGGLITAWRDYFDSKPFGQSGS